MIKSARNPSSNLDPIPCDWNRDLSFDQIAVFAQFMCEGNFVHDLENARTEPAVESVGSIDDQCCDFIFFHVGKAAPLLPSSEANKIAFLPAVSDSRSRTKTIITQRRKDAKGKAEQRNLGVFAPSRATFLQADEL